MLTVYQTIIIIGFAYVVAHDLMATTITPEGDKKFKLIGPFRIYDAYRWLMRQAFWPDWVREGAGCVYCIGGFTALLVVMQTYYLPATVVWLFVTAVAIRAPITFVYQYFHSMHGIGPSDF